jgi:hypothetical protein
MVSQQLQLLLVAFGYDSLRELDYEWFFSASIAKTLPNSSLVVCKPKNVAPLLH